MATVVKTYTENQASSYKATWTLTFSGADVTASGATATVSAPTLQAKYVQSSKNKAYVQLYDVGVYTPNGVSLFGSMYFENTTGSDDYGYYSWASGATKTIQRHVDNATATINTADLFSSSNPTARTVLLYLRGTESGNKIDASLVSTYNNPTTAQWNGYVGNPAINDAFIKVTLNVPPTFTTTAISFDTPYVYTGLTTASVTVSDLTAYYGGNISTATLTIGNQTASRSDNGTLSILLNQSGTFTPTVTVTDSRGQATTQTLNAITVNSYTAPTVQFTAERTLATGVEDDEGTYATVDATFSFSDVVATLVAPSVTMIDDGGTQTTPTVTWYSSRATDGTLSGAVTWSSLSSGATVYALIAGLNTQRSYQVSIRPRDSEGTGTAITQTVASAFYTIDFLAGGHGIAFGQPASQTGLHCDMEATFNRTVDVGEEVSSENLLLKLDTTAATGTDYEIYTALVSLGWDSDCIV